MHNLRSLHSLMLKLINAAKITGNPNRIAPAIGFIEGPIQYVTEVFDINHIELESTHKFLNKRLEYLFDLVPEGFEVVDPIAETHADDQLLLVKGKSASNHPYAIILTPQDKIRSLLIVRLKVVVAFSKVTLARDWDPGEPEIEQD